MSPFAVRRASHVAPFISVAALALTAAAAYAQPTPPARLSVRTDGTQSDHPSTLLGVSANGRHVLFTSNGHLADNDLNGVADLFVRDRDTDADGVFDEPGAVRTVLVSIGPDGTQLGPLPPEIGIFSGGTLSRDGRFVFFSTQWPLVAEDRNQSEDGYLYDRDADADGIFDEAGAAGLSLVTTGSGNTMATGASRVLQVSADGRYALFISSATNLQPRPTTVTQIYRKDRLTSITTLVSSLPDGTPADSAIPAEAVAMSPDGRLVALGRGFQALWPGTTLGAVTYPWVMRDLVANTFTPIAWGVVAPPPTPPISPQPPEVAGFSPDGQRVYLTDTTLLVGLLGRKSGTTLEYDVASNHIIRQWPGFRPRWADAFVDGRTLPLIASEAYSPTYYVNNFGRGDRVTGRATTLAGELVLAAATSDRRTLYSAVGFGPALLDERYGVPLPMPAPVRPGLLDATGTTVFFTSADAAILPAGADTNGVDDVFAVDLLSRLDRDADGLDDRWEAAMGLDYTSGAGADGPTGDPDGDGLTNQQEQTAGSHPRGTVSQFLAEGAENAFFKTRLGIANPGATAATAVVRFDGNGGASTAVNVHVPAGAKRTLFVDEVAPPTASFSVAVESSAPLVSDRTMSWDATEYGAHSERASAAPATTWFLAEGSTGGFALFYLLQNPGDTAATATIRYLRPTPLAPIERVYSLPAHSRTTIPVNTQAPELAATDVSASIAASQPILVERAM
jgi:hypothetical protein